jgi:hypothetical protein
VSNNLLAAVAKSRAGPSSSNYGRISSSLSGYECEVNIKWSEVKVKPSEDGADDDDDHDDRDDHDDDNGDGEEEGEGAARG